MRIGELARSARAVLAASLLLCAAGGAVAAPANGVDALLRQAVDGGGARPRTRRATATAIPCRRSSFSGSGRT